MDSKEIDISRRIVEQGGVFVAARAGVSLLVPGAGTHCTAFASPVLRRPRPAANDNTARFEPGAAQ